MAKKRGNQNVAKPAKQPSKLSPDDHHSDDVPADVLADVPSDVPSDIQADVPSEVPSYVPTQESGVFGADFQRFESYIDECAKYNESVKGHFDRLQKQINNANSRETAIKRKIDSEVNNNNKREKEVLGMIHELQESYDRNTKKLRDHHQKQISHLVDKHKLEMAKWKSKYEKVKFDKKVDKAEVDDAVHIHLQSKLDKVTSELSDWQAKFENMEEQLRNVKKEKMSAQNDLKELRTENSKLKNEVTSKEKEIGKLNDRVKNLESKIVELKKVEPKNVPKDDQKDDKPKSDQKADNTKNESHDDLKDELIKAQADLEATKRQLAVKADVCSYLRKEVSNYKAKVSEFESMVEEEKKKSNEHIQEIERFQRDLEKKKGALQNKDSEIMKLKCNMDENTKNLEMKLKEMQDLQQNEKKWKDKCTEFEKKHQTLLSEIELVKRKNAALRLELQRKGTEIDNLTTEKNKLHRSHETLKKVCTELERQAESYSQKFTNVASAKKSLQKQQCSISDEMSSLKNDLFLANQKNSQLLLEKDDILNKLSNKEHELNTLLTNEKNRVLNLQHELEMSQDNVRRLEDKVSWLEENIEDTNNIAGRYDLENALIKKELAAIKEEASGYISKIYELQKEKTELIEDLDIACANQKTLEESNQKLREYFEMKEEEMQRKKYTLEETSQQQMKLIDFLRKQTDDKINKRKTGNTFEQKFLETQRSLMLEQTKTKELHEELNSLDKEYSKLLKEVELLKSELAEWKNHVAQCHSRRSNDSPLPTTYAI